MIIVSQDKKSIVTLDSAYIMKRTKGYAICTTKGVDTGTYNTEERAKEVLQEIISAVHHCNDIYEMPEE